jgi:hypothetical protein
MGKATQSPQAMCAVWRGQRGGAAQRGSEAAGY